MERVLQAVDHPVSSLSTEQRRLVEQLSDIDKLSG